MGTKLSKLSELKRWKIVNKELCPSLGVGMKENNDIFTLFINNDGTYNEITGCYGVLFTFENKNEGNNYTTNELTEMWKNEQDIYSMDEFLNKANASGISFRNRNLLDIKQEHNIEPDIVFEAQVGSLNGWLIEGMSPFVIATNIGTPLINEMVKRDIKYLYKFLLTLEKCWKETHDKGKIMLADKYFGSILLLCQNNVISFKKLSSLLNLSITQEIVEEILDSLNYTNSKNGELKKLPAIEIEKKIYNITRQGFEEKIKNLEEIRKERRKKQIKEMEIKLYPNEKERIQARLTRSTTIKDKSIKDPDMEMIPIISEITDYPLYIYLKDKFSKNWSEFDLGDIIFEKYENINVKMIESYYLVNNEIVNLTEESKIYKILNRIEEKREKLNELKKLNDTDEVIVFSMVGIFILKDKKTMNGKAFFCDRIYLV